MWDFIELGYEAYNNDVPSILKQNPGISTVQNTVDVSNKFFLVTGPADDQALTAGMAITCATLWATAGPLCIVMYSASFISHYF